MVAVAPWFPWSEAAASNTATPFTVKDASSFTIVPIAAPSATVAPTTFATRSARVSLPSASVSPVTGTVIVAVVAPAAMVRPVSTVAE